MKEIIAILAIVGLVVFGAYMVAEGLHSAGLSYAEAQRYQADRDIQIERIRANLQQDLAELDLLRETIRASWFAMLFWPTLAVVALIIAGCVWAWVFVQVQRDRQLQRQRQEWLDYQRYYATLPPPRRAQAGDWQPAIPQRANWERGRMPQ